MQQDYLQIVEGLPTGQVTQYATCETQKGKWGKCGGSWNEEKYVNLLLESILGEGLIGKVL